MNLISFCRERGSPSVNGPRTCDNPTRNLVSLAGQRRTRLSQQAHPVIRLALVDDQTMFREGLRALIEQEPDLEVVAQATSLQALDEMDVEPHVVVTGL